MDLREHINLPPFTSRRTQEICAYLGYASSDNSDKRSYFVLRSATRNHRKIWTKKQLELSGTSDTEYRFPRNNRSAQVQQCVKEFLQNPEYEHLFKDSVRAREAGWPTLPRDAQNIARCLGQLIVVQSGAYRRINSQPTQLKIKYDDNGYDERHLDLGGHGENSNVDSGADSDDGEIIYMERRTKRPMIEMLRPRIRATSFPPNHKRLKTSEAITDYEMQTIRSSSGVQEPREDSREIALSENIPSMRDLPDVEESRLPLGESLSPYDDWSWQNLHTGDTPLPGPRSVSTNVVESQIEIQIGGQTEGNGTVGSGPSLVAQTPTTALSGHSFQQEKTAAPALSLPTTILPSAIIKESASTSNTMAPANGLNASSAPIQAANVGSKKWDDRNGESVPESLLPPVGANQQNQRPETNSNFAEKGTMMNEHSVPKKVPPIDPSTTAANGFGPNQATQKQGLGRPRPKKPSMRLVVQRSPGDLDTEHPIRYSEFKSDDLESFLDRISDRRNVPKESILQVYLWQRWQEKGTVIKFNPVNAEEKWNQVKKGIQNNFEFARKSMEELQVFEVWVWCDVLEVEGSGSEDEEEDL